LAGVIGISLVLALLCGDRSFAARAGCLGCDSGGVIFVVAGGGSVGISGLR